MLPDYVGNLAQALQVTGAWIALGGIIPREVVAPPPTGLRPSVPSDGESKVGVSNSELPSPQQVIPKVHKADDIEHTLDKGMWVGTGATRHGWKIFVDVSFFLFFHKLAKLLILQFQGQLMERVPTCQRCWELHHECYGLPDQVCRHCQHDKKTCQDVVVKGEFVLRYSDLVFC